MSHCPRASRILAPRGSGHSPAAPAHTILPARMSVTAFDTTGRPVPSHRLARTMASVGFGAGTRRGWGGLPPQAFRVNVTKKKKKKEKKGKEKFKCKRSLRRRGRA